MRAVATRARIAPGLVLHYERSMDAVVADAFARIVRDELDEVIAGANAAPHPVARLAAVLDTLLGGSRSAVTMIWVQSWALGTANPELAARVRDEMDAWHAAIRELIVACGCPIDAPDAVTAQLIGMIDGLNAHALVRWGSVVQSRALMGRAVEGMLGLPSGALAPVSHGPHAHGSSHPPT